MSPARTRTRRPSGAGTATEGNGLVVLYARAPSEIPSAIAIPAAGLVLGRDPPAGELCLPFSSVARGHAKLGRVGRCNGMGPSTAK